MSDARHTWHDGQQKLTLAGDRDDRLAVIFDAEGIVFAEVDGRPVTLDWPAINLLQERLRRALVEAGCTLRDQR